MLRLRWDFTGEKVVSVVEIFNIEVARDFYVAKQRISTSWGVCRRSGARGEPLRRATVNDGCLHHRAESNFRFVPVAQTQCPSTSRRSSLEKSLSSPIMPCSRANFVQGTKRSLPLPSSSRTSDCMYDRRSIEGYGSANRKGPAATCTRRSLRITAHAAFGRLPTAVTSSWRDSRRSLSSELETKPFLIYVFRIWSRRMFI